MAALNLGRRLVIPIAGGAPTIEELEYRQDEIRQRLEDLDTQFAGQTFPPETRTEWNELNDEREKNIRLLDELRARKQRVLALKDDATHQEEGARFNVSRPGATNGSDIWDLSTLRYSAASGPDEVADALHSRALRAVEMSTFPHKDAEQDKVREHIEKLMHRFGQEEVEPGQESPRSVLARRIITTGSPTYQRAFSKKLRDMPLSPDESRALSTTGSAGGFAVPFTLDPTIIPTSNYSVNPLRRIARVESITGETWKGVTSGAITASYVAEGTEASDNAPTLVQPSITVQRAQAFVPFSIEIGQDWGGMQAEMARLLQDAKDDLEATKFLTGGGTNEPFGLLTGLSTTVRVQTAGTAAFVVGDLYALEAALPPRFVPRATAIGSRFFYQKVRQFDTAGGSSYWMGLQEATGPGISAGGAVSRQLLGYPAYEMSTMGTVLTSGTKIAVIGDFSYFMIVDRIGMSIEVIPHLFGASNRFPTGQRGLYAFWRNGSKVLAESAFRYLETL